MPVSNIVVCHAEITGMMRRLGVQKVHQPSLSQFLPQNYTPLTLFNQHCDSFSCLWLADSKFPPCYLPLRASIWGTYLRVVLVSLPTP